MHDRNEKDSARASSSDSERKPYVGLRPYEPDEKDIFFGRDPDARYLTDKIFSSRLTLLYSLSGLGKSSLLRTLVIPSLEKDEARVVYFHAWCGEDPVSELKLSLLELAEEIHIPDARAGAPTLSELVHLISSFDGHSLVLVLDQFEEFLIHGNDIGPLKDELAKIVRSREMDVHILLSLRQEFLAALEPFREKILNLFESTYMLESLSEEGVKQAIEAPARDFGKEYDKELMVALVKDLKELSRKDQLSTPGHQGRIALFMMQIVCRELWDEVNKDVLTIPYDLYKNLGRAAGILNRYVINMMPKIMRKAYFTARLLKYLAPPDGYKMPYSVENLSSVSGLEPERIKDELGRLERRHILHMRQYQKNDLYELQHDAFIGILSPWRDKIIQRAQRVRRAAIGAGMLCLVAVLSLVWNSTQKYIEKAELTKNTRNLLEKYKESDIPENKRLRLDRRKPCELDLDRATSYVLWTYNGADRFDYLKKMLMQYEHIQPELYGITRSGVGFTDKVKKNWPLSLHYSPQRNLDEDLFNVAWWDMAKDMTQNYNIPVPRTLRLVEEKTRPKYSMRLVSAGRPLLDLDIEAHESQAVINSDGMIPDVKDFFMYFRPDWELIEEVKLEGEFYAVPRWSLPVWKVSGMKAMDGSGLTAFLVASELQQHPEKLINTDAVELLLRHVYPYYSKTVSEVRASRGDRLRQDLIEWVKRDHGLLHLPALLDALANYPGASSRDVVSLIGREQSLVIEADKIPRTLKGPWPKTPEEGDVFSTVFSMASIMNEPGREKGRGKSHYSYYQVERWLPPVDKPLCVYLGQDLNKAWLPSGRLSPALEERLGNLSDDFYKRYGFRLPPVEFRVHGLNPGTFMVEVLGGGKNNADSLSIQTDRADGLDQLMVSIETHVNSQRVVLLSSEILCDLMDNLDGSIKKWLYQRYSLTDLKCLARGVIGPDHQPQSSLRNFDWLMGALVFWTQVHDPLDANALAGDLRATQEARLHSKEARSTPGSVYSDIRQGLGRLRAGKPDDAMPFFKTAVTADRDAAIRAFLNEYSRQLERRNAVEINGMAENPTRTKLSDEQRIDLEDYLDASMSTEPLDKQRSLMLCLHNNCPDDYPEKRRTIEEKLFSNYGRPDEWPPLQAKDFAIQVLRTYDPVVQDRQVRLRAEAFLKSAIRNLDENQCELAAFALSRIYFSGGPKQWCLRLMVDLADERPDWILPTYAASLLSGQENEKDLHHAIDLLNIAEKNIKVKSLISKTNAYRLNASAAFTKATALMNLGILGDHDSLNESEKIFAELKRGGYNKKDAFRNHIEIQLIREDYEHASRLLESALREWPEDHGFYLQKFWVLLNTNHIADAANTAQGVVEKCGQTNEALFVAALGQILTGQGPWEETGRSFLQTDHQYGNLVAMLLYSKLAGFGKQEAMQLLEQQWADVEQDTWDARLREGDDSVWREMLVGYYLEKQSHEDIFGPLRDDVSFTNSNFNNLPLSRSSMLCEAYFYDAMLAKAKGDRTRMKKSLKKVIGTSKRNYYEYRMAQYLLDSD